jgi:ketosteroid isomerase-like protein
MAIQRATDEANIRQRINRWVEALRAMDLESVMLLYAPDIVSFDIFRKHAVHRSQKSVSVPVDPESGRALLNLEP